MARKKTLSYLISKRYDAMMSRCYRETDPTYKNHGARGIRVCSDWIKNKDTFDLWFMKELERCDISIENFIVNSKKYFLDRRDTTGHYTPDNCRIVSPQENARNSRDRNRKTVISAEGEKIEI